MSFSEQVTEQLDYYVYALEDPSVLDKVQRVFYIGKGKGNRVFAHLAEGVRETGEMPLKLEKIKEIRDKTGKDPEFSIIQHGLTEKRALALEAQLISVFDGLTNLVGGHYGVDTWLSQAQVNNRYDEPISVSVIKTPALFVSLNAEPSYPEIAQDEETLKYRTLGDWNVTGDTAKSVTHIYGCYANLVRCVYDVSESNIEMIDPGKPGRHRRTRWADGKRDTGLEKAVANRFVVDEHGNVLSVMPRGASRRYVSS